MLVPLGGRPRSSCVPPSQTSVVAGENGRVEGEEGRVVGLDFLFAVSVFSAAVPDEWYTGRACVSAPLGQTECRIV